MERSKRKGHITRTRNRYAKEAKWGWLLDRKCYIVLRVTDGPSHAEIQEDWWEQRMDCRVAMTVSLKIFSAEGEPFMRSERHYCITKEDALLADGRTLHHPFVASPSVPSTESYLWHFTGGIAFKGEMIPERLAFCEYNAKSRSGAIIITFDGRFLPLIYTDYRSVLYDVRVFKPGEYDWLRRNW